MYFKNTLVKTFFLATLTISLISIISLSASFIFLSISDVNREVDRLQVEYLDSRKTLSREETENTVRSIERLRSETLKREFRSQTGIILGIILSSIILALISAFWLYRILNRELTLFGNFFQDAASSADDTKIDIRALRFQEFQKLASSANIMIDHRKTAEEERRAHEQFFRLITDNIQDAIRVIDLKTLRYTYATPYAITLFGMPDQQYIDSPLGVNLAEGDRQHLFRIIHEELEHDAGRERNRSRLIELQEKNQVTGETIWTENKASFIRDPDGKPTAILSIVRDITERRRAERAIQESEERLRKAQTIAHVGNWEIDLQTRQIWASEEAFRIYGVERVTPEMPLDVAQRCVLPQYRTQMDLALQRLIGREGEYDEEFQIKRANDGEVRVIHSRAELVLAEDGTPVKVAGAIQDISEHRKLEEALHRAEKMEALGQLAGGVAHDLNNVLGVLVGYSELLREKIPAGNPLKKYAANILTASEKGALIIEDLLTLARRGVSVADVINLNHIVSGYLKTPVFEKLQDYHPRVTFRTELDPGLLNIKGSPIHLEKTVMNLISNAAEAISGGGEVMIRTENRYVDNAIHGYDDVQEGDYIVLTVADNGSGITAADLDKIFEPFYTKKVMGRSGTGLGLAVVWGTVKDHNGYVTVQSEDGKGSTFALYFPVTREQMADDLEKMPIAQCMGRGESILVIDDVEAQKEMAATMIAGLDYQVHTASSGEEAVAYLQTHTVDLLVLDMIMDPGMDGLETYKRALAINPKQKAVIVSGFSETDRVREAQHLGAGPYVKKPYVLEKIALAIRDELNR
jgi:PAS domain S-box-containing protein